MGLDTSHDCWHGPYSAFNRWRHAVAKAALVPLDLMEGFHDCPRTDALEWAAPRDGGPTCGSHFGPVLHSWCKKVDDALPISWEALRPDVIHVLLNHSDCDGSIKAYVCRMLADRLEALTPAIPVEWHPKTEQFIAGLRAAYDAEEDVEFH